MGRGGSESDTVSEGRKREVGVGLWHSFFLLLGGEACECLPVTEFGGVGERTLGWAECWGVLSVHLCWLAPCKQSE